MGIFSRMSDIINANINALLDAAENPEKMIRLVIQEMEETLVEVRTSSAKMIAEKKALTRRQQRLDEQAADWQQKAELALTRGREDLAKAALVEKSNVLTEVEASRDELAKLDETLNRLVDEIAKLQAKLDDARSRQKALVLRTRATQSRSQVNRQLHDGSVDKALEKLNYFERKIEQMEGQLEADQLGRSNLVSEFDQLAMDDKIDRELAELKAKMASKA